MQGGIFAELKKHTLMQATFTSLESSVASNYSLIIVNVNLQTSMLSHDIVVCHIISRSCVSIDEKKTTETVTRQ
mgnify:CR=1 FL=1